MLVWKIYYDHVNFSGLNNYLLYLPTFFRAKFEPLKSFCKIFCLESPIMVNDTAFILCVKSVRNRSFLVQMREIRTRKSPNTDTFHAEYRSLEEVISCKIVHRNFEWKCSLVYYLHWKFSRNSPQQLSFAKISLE